MHFQSPLVLSCVVLGGVVEVVGSNLARSKIFTASIGSVDLLYPSVFIYCVNLHKFLILCSSKAMMFVKLYFRTSDIYLISLVSLDPSGFHLRTKYIGCITTGPIYDVYFISHRQYHCYLNILFWGCIGGAVSSADIWCCLGGVVFVVGSNLARGKIFTASIGSVDFLYP